MKRKSTVKMGYLPPRSAPLQGLITRCAGARINIVKYRQTKDKATPLGTGNIRARFYFPCGFRARTCTAIEGTIKGGELLSWEKGPGRGSVSDANGVYFGCADSVSLAGGVDTKLSGIW